MALLWHKNVDGTVHEVRSAGATRRLYTDGVFHSQYNPKYPVAGHVWDLLMLPAFFLEIRQLKRVLVLGSGGGAVMHQLNHFINADAIVGIDNNSLHHHAARKYFGVVGQPFQLVEADADEWITEYNGLPFDLIIDDLYGEYNGEPHRPITPNAQWFTRMCRLLSPSGLLVINFMSLMDLQASAWYSNQTVRCAFPSGFRLNMDNYENVIGVFGKHRLSREKFMWRLKQHKELDQRRKTTRLNYQLRKLVHV